MSVMSSETSNAPLFQAHMLSHGQKRKHSNGSTKHIISPSGPRIVAKITNTHPLPVGRGAHEERAAKTITSAEENVANNDSHAYIRLGGRLDDGQPEEEEITVPVEPFTGDEARRLSSYMLPFPARAGLNNVSEVLAGEGKGRKSSEMNKTSENAPAIRTRKDATPKVFGDAIAGHYPWKGQEVEDKLTEHVIKNGFTDRQHVSGELNSASNTLGLYLKQPATIQNLSTLLVTAMQMRQENCRVTANSTFKPPPRVTLTDTRREAWLRDLADEAIPLRRLSRTIPHGIRGRVLLDHCLEKSIPVKRAVWLAQCVGANEIRAFKRKGVSGAITTSNERKWVQEWTTTLEIFLETILQRCVQPEFKTQLLYAIDLTRHLYSEQLLDRDHFLNWSLTIVENSKLAHLPLHLLIVRIIWKDLLLCFRLSSRLISILMKEISILMTHQEDAEAMQLLAHLQYFVADAISMQPLSAIITSDWQLSRPCILSLLKTNIVSESLHRSKLLERSDRLALLSSGASYEKSTPQAKCFAILDARMSKARALVKIEPLTQRCLDALPAAEELTLALMQWACSVYRVGYHRIYIVARLLRDLARRGYDLTGIILQCLGGLKTIPGISAKSVTSFLADLVMTRDFDVGRYLRWLIATGSLNGCSRQDFSIRCDLRFLVEMPTTRLPTNVTSMRLMLLRRCAVTPSADSSPATSIIDSITQCLRGSSVEPKLSSRLFREADVATKEKVADWLITVTCRGRDPNSFKQTSNTAPDVQLLDQDGLCVVLDVLRSFKDQYTIARIIDAYVDRSDMDMLVPLSETLLINRDELSALGGLPNLWLKVLGRYRSLRNNALPEKRVVFALDQVSSALHPPTQVLEYLKQEVTLAEQSAVSSVFTPASEGMMDNVENTGTDSYEDIERLLANSTTLDPSSMRRIFLSLAKRLLSEEEDYASSRCSRPCALLSKLRLLGAEEYSRLLQEFLTEAGSRLPSSQKHKLFQILLGGEVCSFAELSERLHSGDYGRTGISEFLDLNLDLYEGTPCIEPSLRFHFILLRCRYLESNGENILKDAMQVMTKANTATTDSGPQMGRMLGNPALMDLFKRFILTDAGAFMDMLEKCIPPKTKNLEKFTLDLVSNLMASNDDTAVSGLTVDHEQATDGPLLSRTFSLKAMFESVNELSFPFWKLILQLRLQASAASTKPNSDLKTEAVEAVTTVVSRKDFFWTHLLPDLGETAAREVLLFVSNTIVAPSKLREMVASNQETHLRRLSYLEILKSTSFAVRSTPQPELAQKITTALSSLYAHWKDEDASTSSDEAADDRKSFTNYLQIVLNLVLILHTTFRKPSYCSDLLQVLCKFLATNISIRDRSTAEFVFDVAAFFVADLESNMLQSIHDSLPKTVRHHEAVQFLLGTGRGRDGWLHLAQKLPSQQHLTSSWPNNSEQLYSSTSVFPLRSWELLPDAAPAVGPNDTALSLRLFDAKKLS